MISLHVGVSVASDVLQLNRAKHRKGGGSGEGGPYEGAGTSSGNSVGGNRGRGLESQV